MLLLMLVWVLVLLTRRRPLLGIHIVIIVMVTGIVVERLLRAQRWRSRGRWRRHEPGRDEVLLLLMLLLLVLGLVLRLMLLR